MSSCEQTIERLCQYADGALPEPERAEVDRHLARCRDCQSEVATQRAVRAALRTHAGALREPASVGLRSRVTAMVASPAVLPFRAARPRRASQRWARVVPASLAAGLVLAVGIGALAPSGTVLAAQLALDHLKCRVIATVSPEADPGELARRWQHDRGWPIAVPGSRPELRLSLLGLRNCLYHDGTMAHLMYDYRGHRVSLFVMPHREAAAPDMSLLGQHTLTWAASGRTYAVVADAAAGDLGEVAAYLRQDVR
jgi:anti-sigma factor RsiW